MTLWLQHRFAELFQRFSTDEKRQDQYWLEIQKNYSQSDRHYHNLQHLAAMLTELDAVNHDIQQREILDWAVFYHDIIYKITSKKNEEKSADLAVNRLKTLALPPVSLNKIHDVIAATKSHNLSNCSDTNYLLDADLAVLGKAAEQYDRYAQQVRKEFAIYPRFLYNSGRKKVLEHFLNKERIYKTDFFVAKYEAQAMKNLRRELENL